MPRLNARAFRLLHALTASWHAGHTLTVTVTTPRWPGRSATVHLNLARLKQKGLVSVDENGGDLKGGRRVLTDAGFNGLLCFLAW